MTNLSAIFVYNFLDFPHIYVLFDIINKCMIFFYCEVKDSLMHVTVIEVTVIAVTVIAMTI